MGKVKGKHRLDKYYRLAKEHGYRSRASWKLIQLDNKFRFLYSAQVVLDLCAAPGGWMQVAVEKAPVGSYVLGIDLDPIAPVRGAEAIRQDITTPECKTRIKRLLSDNGRAAVDLILMDGSPNVGGAWAQEATSQNALVIAAVKLATEFLAPKGNFVTKVFRSQDYNSVLYCLRQLFEKVEVEKPAASRSASAEIYVLGLKYKAPAKIDPRLLDVKTLFQGAVEPPRKLVDPLRPTKQKRHRDGYEDGDTTLRKVSSAKDFVWSDAPLDILGSVTSITFKDPDDLLIKNHELTTEEVKTLCDDLGVLGKQDFKHLLRWRLQVRKALSPTQKKPAPPTEAEFENKSEEDEDDKLLNEMEELSHAMDRKKKREKKLLAKRRVKDKARKATGMQIDALDDTYGDEELFSLASIKGKKELLAVDSTEYEDEGQVSESDNEDVTKEVQEQESSDIDDSDEERRRYDDKMEGLLDQAYEQFVAKREGSTKQRKRAKKSYSEEGQLLETGEGDEIADHPDYDSEEDNGEQEANPLVVPLKEGDGPTQDEVTNMWFSGDVFTDAVEEGDFGMDDINHKMDVDMEDSERPPKNIAKQNKKEISTGFAGLQSQPSKVEDDIEVVPEPATDSSDDSSSDESEELDDDRKAEILAMAKKMLRKKQREDILDDAYNKYMFHDDGLPKWFLDEEMRHRQPMKPVTKEEVAAMRAQFKQIDARTPKKVAQAKFRKKRDAMRKLEKIRKKANAISDQTDINDRSKSRQIEQLYSKATPKRPQKEYVVAKKGVHVKAGKGKVLVDRRMKKDARGRGMDKAGKGGKKMKNVSQKGKSGKKMKDVSRKGKGDSKGRKGSKM